MRLFLSLAAAALAVGLAAPATTAQPSVHFGVSGAPWRTCVDTPLRLTFPATPTLGTSGAITIRRADGTVADRIDLADPASGLRTIGDARSDDGELHLFHYYPVIVTGDTATIYPHHELDHGRRYSVTVDGGVFTGLPESHTWWFATTPVAPPPGSGHLTVAADGSGDFCTVQGAIDALPHGNRRPVTIDVHPGTYTEIDYVAPDRPFVTVRGASRAGTVIQYPNNDKLNGDEALTNGTSADVCPLRTIPASDTHNCWRATFGVDAPDFTLEDLTIHNTTPHGGSQAEAFRGNNQRITLNRVALDSYQDTLRLQGTGFVTDSYIEGDVDFVWGTGTVYLADSELKALNPGYYTQIRNDQAHHGDVFVDDRLTRAPGVPDGSSYLGRIQQTRFPYSQAVYLDTAMDAHIAPAGWLLMRGDCSTAPDLQYWEYHSTDLAGKPLDVSHRLPCSAQLTDAQAAQWRDPGFVLYGWVPTTVNASLTGPATATVHWSASVGHSAGDRIALYRDGVPVPLWSWPIGGTATTGTLTVHLPPVPCRYRFGYLPAGAIGAPAATSDVVTES